MIQDRRRVRILDVDVDLVTTEELPKQLERLIEEGKPRQVVTVNLQFLSLARKNPEWAKVINSAGLAVADGVPLVWISKVLDFPIPARITGHDLLHHSAALAAEKGYTIFLLGGAPDVAREAAAILRKQYPGLMAVGVEGGRFPARGESDDQEKLVKAIKDFQPQFLFVGLGCPKQDFWIYDYMEELGVPVSAGIGCTFDVLTGRMKRSPVWMQRWCLEWIFRLMQEPGRLWKRYILGDIPTALRIIGSVVQGKLFGKVRA